MKFATVKVIRCAFCQGRRVVSNIRRYSLICFSIMNVSSIREDSANVFPEIMCATLCGCPLLQNNQLFLAGYSAYSQSVSVISKSPYVSFDNENLTVLRPFATDDVRKLTKA